jgi:hypothetical protein
VKQVNTNDTEEPVANPPNPKFQLPLRTVLILLLALTAGSVTGLLTFAAGGVLAQAVLAGLGASAAAIYAFDRWIE